MNHKITAVMFSMLIFSAINASEKINQQIPNDNTNNTCGTVNNMINPKKMPHEMTLSDKVEELLNERILDIEKIREGMYTFSHPNHLIIKHLNQLQQFYYSMRFEYLRIIHYSLLSEIKLAAENKLSQLHDKCFMHNNNKIDCNELYNITVKEICDPIHQMIRDENNKNK